jgi:hypothetical protein
VQGIIEQHGGDDSLMLRRLKVRRGDREMDGPSDLALRGRVRRVRRPTPGPRPHEGHPANDRPADPPPRHRHPSSQCHVLRCTAGTGHGLSAPFHTGGWPIPSRLYLEALKPAN